MAIHVGSFKKVQTKRNEQYNEFNEIIIFHLNCSNSLLLSFLNCQVFFIQFSHTDRFRCPLAVNVTIGSTRNRTVLGTKFLRS